MGGEPENKPDNRQPENYSDPAQGWPEAVQQLVAPLIDKRTPVELHFRPYGEAFDHIELKFGAGNSQFVGFARVDEVEASLNRTGYPVDLWLTLVGKSWPALILACVPAAENALRLSLELQDLILFLPFEKRSDGNRPLNLRFYASVQSGDFSRSESDEALPVDTEPELIIKGMDRRSFAETIWGDTSILDPESERLSVSSRPTRQESVPMPELRPIKRKLMRLRGQPNLTYDDQPFVHCIEITAQQSKSTINEAILKRSLSRAAGCDEKEVVPLAMTHSIDELVILVQLPDEIRLQRFLTYFAYHQAKLGDQMRVSPYVSLPTPRRWVWRQLVATGSFERHEGRLSFMA